MSTDIIQYSCINAFQVPAGHHLPASVETRLSLTNLLGPGYLVRTM